MATRKRLRGLLCILWKRAIGSCRWLNHSQHGAALARLGNYGSALSAFLRAIDVSQQIGSVSRAAQAALTMTQEIGERLAVEEKEGLISGRTLNEEIHSVERHLIKHALEANEVSVTRAVKISVSRTKNYITCWKQGTKTCSSIGLPRVTVNGDSNKCSQRSILTTWRLFQSASRKRR